VPQEEEEEEDVDLSKKKQLLPYTALTGWFS